MDNNKLLISCQLLAFYLYKIFTNIKTFPMIVNKNKKKYSYPIYIEAHGRHIAPVGSAAFISAKYSN